MSCIQGTKKQFNETIREAVNVTVNTGMTNGNVAQAVTNTRNDVMRNGINPNKVGYVIPAEESKDCDGKELKETELNRIKKDGTKFTKKELSEAFDKDNTLMYGELAQIGGNEMRDNIIRKKNEYVQAIENFLNKLKESGLDIKGINKAITMYDLTPFIPKTVLNRFEREMKKTTSVKKELANGNKGERK